MTNFLVRILTLAAFSLLFPSLWGCGVGGTPQNLISNGSFEGDIKGWSIGQNANIVLTQGNPQSFFLKKIFLDRNSKIRLFPDPFSPDTPVTINGSVEIANPILKKIPASLRTYTLKKSLGKDTPLQVDSNNKKFGEVSLEEIIPNKIFEIFGMPIIKPLADLFSIRIVVNLASHNGHIKIVPNEPNLLTSVDFIDEWKDYRNVEKQDWSYTKKFDYLPLHGNQTIMVDSWKTHHITQKISGLEPGKAYLLLAGRRNVLGPVSPSVQIIEENGTVLEKSIFPFLLHEGWVRSLVLFKPQHKTVLVQLGGGSKSPHYPYRFVNLYDDIRLYKIPEGDTEEFYRYLQTHFSILPNDISAGFKVVDYETIMPEVFREAYYNEHESFEIPVLDLFYDSAAFWRAQLDAYSSDLKKDPNAFGNPRKLKNLFPAQLKIDKKNTREVGFKHRGVHSPHYVGRNKSLKIAHSKKNKMYLLNPQTRNWLSEPFAYFVSRQMGGMGMRSDFVFLRMNGKPKGISWRYWKDHADLEFNRRPDGALLENRGGLYHLIRTEKDWNTVVRPQNKKMRKQYPAKKVITLLMTFLRKDLIGYIDGLANIEKFLTWHAHCLIVNSSHQNDDHNSFFYLNSADGRLEPVPIDINMGTYSTIDHENNVKHFNPVIDRLLANFKFFNRRDQIIWEYISDTKKIRAALKYYDDLYKKNINTFTKAHMVSIGGDAPFSHEEIKNFLRSGEGVFLERTRKLNQLFRENNTAAINITEYRQEGDSKSPIKQVFEIKISPKQNTAWSSTLLESVEVTLNDVNGKVKIFPETPGKRHKNRVMFPLQEFIPSDKFFIYQISHLWEDEYFSVLEKLKRFPKQLEIIQKNYTKHGASGYSLGTDALKNKNLVESLISIFTSIGKINAGKKKRFVIQYEGVSPLIPSQDFSFSVKNGVTLEPIIPEVLVAKKIYANKGILKTLKIKGRPALIGDNINLLSKVLQNQSVYRNYRKIYLPIEEFLAKNPEFVAGNSKNTIVLRAGVHRFSEKIILPKGIELIIQPGTELRFDTGVSLISYGIIRALGTKQKPIIFHGYEDTTKWGVVGLLHEKARGFFENCIFEGGGEAYINGAYFSGMLAAHYADLEVRSSIFRKAGKGGGDDAINIKYGKALISDSYFFKNGGDAIDLDFAKQGSEIRDSYFLENGNDGIDVSGSKVVIQNILVSKSGDKGVSLGERTHAEIKGLRIEDSTIAITSKDSSKVKLSHSVFINNSIGAMAYRKKKLYEGGEIHITNTLFEDNKFDLLAQVCSDKEKVIRKEDCSSKIYIEDSKYKTHNRTFNATIGSPSKQITSKKKHILASWKGSLSDYGYVRLSDAEIIKESPPRLEKENLLENFSIYRTINKFKMKKGTPFPLSTKGLLDVSSAAWKEKNPWYLIKRELGLNLDPEWRYFRDLHNTVIQRRFNMDLEFIETIDIAFRDEIPEQDLQNLVCNFRISNPNSKNAWPMSTKHHYLIPHENLVIRDNDGRNRIFKTRGGKAIRFDMESLNYYALNPGEGFFLEEIIIHLPTSLEEVIRIRPVESIRFQKREEDEHLDEIEPARLLKEQAKMTRPAVQEKKINQFKRNPLDVDALIAKLPKWTSP